MKIYIINFHFDHHAFLTILYYYSSISITTLYVSKNKLLSFWMSLSVVIIKSPWNIKIYYCKPTVIRENFISQLNRYQLVRDDIFPNFSWVVIKPKQKRLVYSVKSSQMLGSRKRRKYFLHAKKSWFIVWFFDFMRVLTSLVTFIVLFVNATIALDALWIVKDTFAMFVDFSDRVRKKYA